MNVFVGLIIVVYIYFVSFKHYNCPDVQLRSPHPKTLEIASSNPLGERSVLKLSAPEILQRPAPQPGAPLFGAPRPERPSAPANPGRACWRWVGAMRLATIQHPPPPHHARQACGPARPHLHH